LPTKQAPEQMSNGAPMNERFSLLSFSAFKAIKRLFRANENSVTLNHGRRVNLFFEVVRRNQFPLALVGQDTEHALFAGDIDFSVAGHRRGVIAADGADT